MSPLIALMADQLRRLTADGHPAVMVASGMGEEEAPRRRRRTCAPATPRIVFCSPERFASPAFLGVLEQRGVDLFVIDEAHCLAEGATTSARTTFGSRPRSSGSVVHR